MFVFLYLISCRYIFSPQTERKRSGEYLVAKLAVERKLWAIFLPPVHLWEKQTPGGRLKTVFSAAMRSLLLFMASLFIGFLVDKYITCQNRKRRNPISDGIVFVFHLAWCVKRVEKSEAILGLLNTFRTNKSARARRASALCGLWKIYKGLFFSKLHSKSCDYLY